MVSQWKMMSSHHHLLDEMSGTKRYFQLLIISERYQGSSSTLLAPPLHWTNRCLGSWARSLDIHCMKNKPVKEGFKLSVLTTIQGFVITFSPDVCTTVMSDRMD